MRGRCLWVLVLTAHLPACGEQDNVFHAVQAAEVVTAARERFKLFDQQHRRSLEIGAVEGGFKPVDPPEQVAVIRAASVVGGIWRQPGKHHLKAALPARARGVVRLSNGPVTVVVRPVGSRDVPGDLAVRSVVYRDAYPGADSILLAEKERVEEFLLLRDARAPRRVEYELEVVRGGGRVRQLAGTVEVLDRQGNAWIRMSRPFMIDGAGRRHDLHHVVQGGRLTLSLPRGQQRYPLLVDPGWETTGKMTAARSRHTANLLLNGKVLVAGGAPGLDSCELYDEATGTWTATGKMNDRRYNHSATLLKSGHVLVAGGRTVTALLGTAELYDPSTGKWAAQGSLLQARSHHTATRLVSGAVLVAGGTSCATSCPTALAELFDEQTGKWVSTGSLKVSRRGHTASIDGVGRVVVVGGSTPGGDSKSVERYDKGIWSTMASMVEARVNHSASWLSCGLVIAGGQGKTPVLDSTEIFGQPWIKTASMKHARHSHSATVIKSGKLLVAGGGGVGNKSEIFDPKSKTWSSVVSLLAKRAHHTATLLTTGRVLVAGGTGLSSAEIYNHTTGLSCTSNAQCASGNCVDGVCCQSACTGTCMECVAQSGSQGTLGQCVPVAVSKPDLNAKATCTAPMACSGVGVCKKANGQTCTAGGECATGLCADGRCCPSACQDTCKSCGLPGSQGICSNIPAGVPDPLAKVTCTSTTLCDGQGSCKKAPGQTCSAPGQCASGHCVDGYCCSSSCTASCMSCGAPGKQGACSPIPSGLPDAYPANTCSGAKACDGAGTCKKANGQACNGGGECATGQCIGGRCCQSCSAPGQCFSGHCVDGYCCNSSCTASCMSCGVAGQQGACSPIPPGVPDAYPANACSGAKACDGAGTCKAANGLACASGAQCGSGHCVDGHCCHSACKETCRSCGLAGKLGTCAVVPAAVPDKYAATPCTGAQACDGAGTCKTANGQLCTSGAQCGSGLCVDSYCCDTTCMDTCKACNVKASLGQCAFVLAGKQDGNATIKCVGKTACNGKGACWKSNGQICGSFLDCGSGYCVDGYCCDSLCNQNCVSCKLVGSKGSCSAIPTGTDPENDCIGKDPKCGGSCASNGGCEFPSVGTSCGSSPCMVCDGTGQCTKTPIDDSQCGTIDCDKLDSACKDYHDLTDQRCEALGLCKQANSLNSCTRFSAVACGDAKVGLDLGSHGDQGSTADRGGGGRAEQGAGCSCRAGGLGDHGHGAAGLLCVVLVLGLALRKHRS